MKVKIPLNALEQQRMLLSGVCIHDVDLHLFYIKLIKEFRKDAQRASHM